MNAPFANLQLLRYAITPLWGYTLAIISEVIGTTALRASDGFSKPWGVGLVVVGYAAAFYLVSLTLKQIPLGVTYAVWSGIGLVATAIVSNLIWHEEFNLGKLVGLALILVGIVILNLFSQSAVSV